MNNSINMLSPFVLYCQKVIPLAFDESMSYYECLCALYSYLKDTVVPAVNNNAEALEEVQKAMIELKDYVDHYFDNLDIQTEIDNKLDEMADSGELAEIITAYLEVNGVLGYDTIQDMSEATNLIEGSICRTLGETLYNDGKGAFYKIRQITVYDTVDGVNIVALDISNTLIAEKMPDFAINQLTSSLATTNTKIKQYPLYNVLENGGYDDGATDNTSVLSSAYSNGFYRFYFPQNESMDAKYYFADNVDFTNYEILTDDGVILSFKNAYCVTKGKYLSNIKVEYRAEGESSVIPRNVPDLFNSCLIGVDYSMKNVKSWYDVSLCTLVIYDYNNDGKFKIHSNPITNYYTNDSIYFKLTSNPTFHAVCVPVNDNTNCVETNSATTTSTLYGIICDTTTGAGYYINYTASSTIHYFDEHKNGGNFVELNIHKHNRPNNDYNLPMSYKMKYNKENHTVEVFINNSLVSIFYCSFTPNYFGFGTNTNNSVFTRLTSYKQEYVPLNYKLNILIAGDSRFYNGGRPYQIEDILENSLKYNAINTINIDNKSVAGYTLSQINTLIQNQTASEYDIVIIEGGINNYGSTANEIATTTASMLEYCKTNGIIPILTTCMPTAPGGSDAASLARAQKYYMISNAMNIGYGTNPMLIGKLIDNVSGLTTDDTTLPIMPDGVHPSTVGIIEIAKAITDGILRLQ